MTNSSLVLELQKEAIKPNCIVSNLIRTAYLIAKKLNITDIIDWLNNELNGYSPENKNIIPEYRIIHLHLKGKTINGWVSATIPLDYIEIEKFYCFFSVAEIEKLIANDEEFCYIKLHPSYQTILCQLFNCETDYKGGFHKGTLITILEKIKTKILDWAIELESRGILGENLMFTEDEKHKANTIINNHFHGNVENTQIQQNSDNSTQNQLINQNNIDITAVHKLIDEINTLYSNIKFSDTTQSNDFNSKLDIINEELKSQTPNSGKIKSAVLGLKSILEKVSVSVISTGIIHLINNLL